MPAGRPPKWTSAEEVRKRGEEYFDSFKEGGENHGRPITITGLAYHLDTTRQTLCDYEADDEFTDTIKRLKLRVERFAEERMYEGAATGPIFALKNFGWKDAQDFNHGGQKDNPIITTTDEEIIKRYINNKKDSK